MLPYMSAKAGVAHFTRCLAVELGQHGIRANCVAPANIATEINAAFDKAAVTRLQPFPHHGLPDDVVEAVVYLSSEKSPHVTGVVLAVDGGIAVRTPPRTYRCKTRGCNTQSHPRTHNNNQAGRQAGHTPKTERQA